MRHAPAALAVATPRVPIGLGKQLCRGAAFPCVDRLAFPATAVIGVS
jgi:hypothetical protein